MACKHYFMVDSIKQFRGKQSDVILDGLKLVSGFISPVVMAKHLAKCIVVIGQIMKPIVIKIEIQSNNTKYQDCPLLHARTTGIRISFPVSFFPFGTNLFKNGKNSFSQLLVGVNALKPLQDFWHIITAFLVKNNGRNIGTTKHHLVVDDATHIGFRKTKFGAAFSLRVPCNTFFQSTMLMIRCYYAFDQGLPEIFKYFRSSYTNITYYYIIS